MESPVRTRRPCLYMYVIHIRNIPYMYHDKKTKAAIIMMI